MGQLLGIRGGASTDKVDPRMLDIVKNAVAATPYDAKIYSGSEPRTDGRGHSIDKGNHGPGYAIDIQLYQRSPDGKLVELPNRGTSAYSDYEQYAQAARVYQQQKYPELSNRFRTGLGFETSSGSGVLDPMHLDIRPGGGMQSYSWDKGGTGQFAKLSNGGLNGPKGPQLVAQYQSALKGMPDTATAYANPPTPMAPNGALDAIRNAAGPPLPRPRPDMPQSTGPLNYGGTSAAPVPASTATRPAAPPQSTGPFNYGGGAVVPLPSPRAILPIGPGPAITGTDITPPDAGVPLPRPRPIGGDLNSLDAAANDPFAGVNAQLGAEPARPTGKTIPDPKFPNVPFTTTFPPANTMLGGASKQVPQSALQGAANGLSGVADGLASLGGGGTPPLPRPRPATPPVHVGNPANHAVQFIPASSPSQSISPSNSSSFGDIFTSAPGPAIRPLAPPPSISPIGPGPAIVGTDLNRQQAKQVVVDNPAFAAWAHNQKLAGPFSNPGVQGLSPDDRDSPNHVAIAVPGLATPAPPRTILRTVPAPVYHTPAPAYAPQAPIQPLTPGNGYTYLPNGNGGYTRSGVTNPGLTPSQQYAVANGGPALTINSGPFASAGNNNDSARAQMGPGGSLTGI
jgi:hypothetical protein